MTATPAPTSLYASRWKMFLMALFCAGWLVVDLLHYFVWPTPPVTTHPESYQEPFKTILFIVFGLVLLPFTLYFVYWTLTPRPMLHLSAASLVYRPFPRPTRTIYWEDVELANAFALQQPTRLGLDPTILTLYFTFKPHRLSAYQTQPKLKLDIRMAFFSLHADELIHLMNTYHHVQSLNHLLNYPKNPKNPKNPRNSRAARTIRRRNHSDHRSSQER